jgi:beta-phosphoglucomutase-like phosphatase (HAD superfamily)
MFSGFIFDVEGTLVDSVPQNLRSLQDALERSGYRVPYQTLQLYSGLDGDQTLQLAIPEASEEERTNILKVQGTIYERDYLSSVKPFEGIRDIFRILTQQGARVALATDCKGLAFKRYISLIDADEFIAATACGDDVEHGKPDPRLVGIALRKLALPSSQAVMVGDTGAGCYAVGEDLRGLLPSLLSGEAISPTIQPDFLKSA